MSLRLDRFRDKWSGFKNRLNSPVTKFSSQVCVAITLLVGVTVAFGWYAMTRDTGLSQVAQPVVPGVASLDSPPFVWPTFSPDSGMVQVKAYEEIDTTTADASATIVGNSEETKVTSEKVEKTTVVLTTVATITKVVTDTTLEYVTTTVFLSTFIIGNPDCELTPAMDTGTHWSTSTADTGTCSTTSITDTGTYSYMSTVDTGTCSSTSTTEISTTCSSESTTDIDTTCSTTSVADTTCSTTSVVDTTTCLSTSTTVETTSTTSSKTCSETSDTMTGTMYCPFTGHTSVYTPCYSGETLTGVEYCPFTGRSSVYTPCYSAATSSPVMPTTTHAMVSSGAQGCRNPLTAVKQFLAEWNPILAAKRFARELMGSECDCETSELIEANVGMEERLLSAPTTLSLEPSTVPYPFTANIHPNKTHKNADEGENDWGISIDLRLK